MKIISADISLNKPGYAIYNNNKLESFNSFKSKDITTLDKLLNIEQFFYSLFETEKPDLLLIENAPANHARTKLSILEILHSVNWLVRLQAHKLGIEIIGIHPISWKSYFKREFNNKLKMSKSDNIKYVNQIFNLNLTTKQQDEADAISLLVYHLQLHQ